MVGFDRLREMGFSEEEVREARRVFYSVRRSLLRGNESRNELLQLEEEFMASANLEGNTQQPQHQQLEQEGSTLDLYVGMLLGFLLGLIMLFVWVEDNKITTKRKCGILIGLGCNLSFSILKLLVL